MIVNIMNILITTASEISSEKLILFLLKNKKYNIKCTELSKFKESCNKDLDIAFNNLEDSKNINFLIDKSEKAVIIETKIAPIAKKNMIKVGIKNSAIKKLIPIKNQIKYILINLSMFNYKKLKLKAP